MSANVNPLPTVPASRNVREFLAVCARHNVPYGDLNCLPALLRELKANKHFAMHFWSAVAGMTEKQAAGTETVLADIIEAVTGRPVAEVRAAGPAHRILVDRLERMLTGVDVETEDVPEIKPVARPEPAPAAESPVSIPAAEEDVLPIRRVAEPRRRGRRARHAENPVLPVPAPARARDESLRIVLVPEPEPATTPHHTRLDEIHRPTPRPTAVPLSNYSETAPRRSAGGGVVLGVLVAALLGGVGYVVAHGGVQNTIDRLGAAVRSGYDSAVATWRNEPAPPPTVATVPAIPSAKPVNSQAPSTSQQAAPQSASPTSQPAQQAAAATSPVSTPRSTPASSALTPAQRAAALAAMDQQRAAMAANPIPDITAADSADGPVSVPEATMNAHLIVSRVPVLPDDVRASGVTGVVRMQALINRAGYVSRLHVLQGATALRHPALEAVSAWRYRPYMVNGRAVDVETTITVDFSSLE